MHDGSRLEGLLEPRLAPEARSGGLYSVRAGFFVAFLGGPFAILLFSALNSRRLGRLARDAWFYALAGVATTVFVVSIAQPMLAGATPEWLAVLGEGRRGLRYASRLIALILFGGVFLLHRRFHRAAQLRGDDPPNPWPPGIAATLVGFGLSAALVALTSGFGS